MIYISAPFSKCGDIPKRLIEIGKYSSKLLNETQNVICLSTMGFNLGNLNEDLVNKDSEWWKGWWERILPLCEEMRVLMFDGWEDSYGVQEEIKLAELNNIKIKYIKIVDYV